MSLKLPVRYVEATMKKSKTGKLRRIRTNKIQQTQKQSSEWVINIHNCLKEGIEYDLGRSWTMYRVPKNMRDIYRKAYVPKLISVGPFHYGEKRLQAMEEHKMRYLLRLLGYEFDKDKVQEHEPDPEKRNLGIVDRLEELNAAVKALEVKARECYSEYFDIGSDDFVQMMVVDGCFLIELLRLYYKFDQEEDVDDPIFSTRWMLRSLQRDLLMLENQLPFFILQNLFNLTSTKSSSPSLLNLIVTFFDPLLPRETFTIPTLNPNEEYDHMLDVFRSTFLVSVKDKVSAFSWKQLQSPNNVPMVQERQLIHSVKELQEAGVKLKRREGSDLLDISFHGHVLEVPPLYIDDNTVPLFLNFVAYEQCDEEAEPFFTNFFMFFDSLISSPEDVEILHMNGIINHVLGTNKDVAHLVNSLGREIVYDLDECYLSSQMKEINDYCKKYYTSRWRVWWANLVREYFSSPWTLLSLLAAIFLLVLTAGQTLYTIYPYYYPPP